NASVRLDGQPGSGCAGSCLQSTDGAGNFRFTNVPARTFTVTAADLAGQQGAVGGILTTGETRTGVEVTLAPAVRLQGRVVLPDGSPAAGVVVQLDRGGTLFTASAQDGTFSFATIGAGAYVLTLQDPVGGGLAKRTGTAFALAPIDVGD